MALKTGSNIKVLTKLYRMQHRVLRISIEAMKTIPINALLVERNEMPLD